MLNLETPAPMNMQSMPLPEGDPGTEFTVAQMRRLIDEGSKDPQIHELAAGILRAARVRPFDFLGEARAVYQWVLRNIRFTRDIRGKETLHAARETVRLGTGDCDDFTILILALAQSVGQQGRIVTVASDGRDPEMFSHVYPEVSVNGRWIALDAARRSPGFGLSPANYYRKRVWDASSPEFQDVAGLGILPMPARPRAVNPPAYYTPPDRRSMRARRRLAGMGIDWSDPSSWSAISGVINSGAAAAANIISATRASPYNLIPTTSPGGQATISPYAALTSQAALGSSWLNSNTLLLLLVLGGVVFAVSRRD